MKKGLFAVSLLLFLIYFSVGASTYSWISDSLFGSSMRSKEDKKEKSQMRPKKKKKTSQMRSKKTEITWKFSKGQINPTVKFYDVSDRNRRIYGPRKIKGNMTIKTACKKGHKICFGGDFELVGKKYIMGCGNNCQYLRKMSSSEKNYACEVCSNRTVRKQTKVRKKASKVAMKWHFKKGQVNPTIKFYDMSNRKRQIHGSVKLQNNTSVSVRCMEGHKVCFGGDFELMGKNYTIGCGKNCKLYNRMSSSEKRYSCEVCRKGNVRKATKVKKR